MRPSLVVSGGKLPAGTVATIAGSAATALTATGSSSTDAYQLSCDLNAFSTVATGTGAILPPCEVGAVIAVRQGGSNALTVYPYSSANTIRGTTSFSQTAAKDALYIGTGTDWMVVMSG